MKFGKALMDFSFLFLIVIVAGTATTVAAASSAPSSAPSKPPCVCQETWTYDEPGCRTPQTGCPATPCDGWDRTWCKPIDSECEGAVDGGNGEFYVECDPALNKGFTPAHETEQNICQCMEWWISNHGGTCGNWQNGCPATACEQDPESPEPWCIVDDINCRGSEKDEDSNIYWAFCDPKACKCKETWTYPADEGCEIVNGCPIEACDGYEKSWCLIESDDCSTAEKEYGEPAWSYCGTGLEKDQERTWSWGRGNAS